VLVPSPGQVGTVEDGWYLGLGVAIPAKISRIGEKVSWLETRLAHLSGTLAPNRRILRSVECEKNHVGHSKQVSFEQPVKGPKSEKVKKETADFVANYNPTKSKFPLAAVKEWAEVGDLVREAVAPMTWMAAHTLRPYLNAVTKLAVWAFRLGLPMDLEYLLNPQVIASFEVNQEQGVASVTAQLSRLGLAHDIEPEVNKEAVGVARPKYQRPYTKEEIDTLVAFARAHTNEYRRAVLTAIIALGAGAGVVRSRMRDVSSTNVHQHDDGVTYVRTATNCAKVREEFVELLNEACVARGHSQLVGDGAGEDLTNRAVAWVAGRVGVPELNIDSLRATYMCSLIEADVPFRQIMAWSGLATVEGLSGYLEYCSPVARSCETRVAK
jgi:integrase